MIVFICFVLGKDSKIRLFKKNFLLADVKPNIIIKMFFLTMNNIDINS